MPTITLPKGVELAPNELAIGPQPGPQTLFMRNSSTICVYGGAAGGGKTYALELLALTPAALRPVPGFGAVIFRRESPQITAEGGLWDTSQTIYPYAGGVPTLTRMEWKWKKYRTKIRFAHLQLVGDVKKWDGSQVPFLAFDELQHFEESQFFYMMSRNRSTCGYRPRMRATCNPHPGWLKNFLAPWVDRTFPNPALSGERRRFIRVNGILEWLDPGKRHLDEFGNFDDTSVTFIAAKVYDNKILLQANPEYLAGLKALPLIEQQRLLFGSWDVFEAGNRYKREWFRPVDTAPADGSFEEIWRFWDLAATEAAPGKDPDYTVGCKVGRKDGIFYVLDVVRLRGTPGDVEKVIRTTAEQDGVRVKIGMEQEPGSAGVGIISNYSRRVLQGFSFTGFRASGNKEVRGLPVSSQAQNGNVRYVRAYWNEAFLSELEVFPTKNVHDDSVDSFEGAVMRMMSRTVPSVRSFGRRAAPAPQEEMSQEAIVEAMEKQRQQIFDSY